MVFNWDENKNDLLKKTRNISFEQIIIDIENGNILDILANSSKSYKNQILIVIDHDNYAYVVPAIKSNNEYFLKTIFPSRKYTDKYLRKTGGKT